MLARRLQSLAAAFRTHTRTSPLAHSGDSSRRGLASSTHELISFSPWGGGTPVVVKAAHGETLLAIAQANGVPLEGACEGSLSCSTCHVILEDDKAFASLPEPCEDELDMLDVALGVTKTSRLGCCVRVSQASGGMALRLPPMSEAELKAAEASISPFQAPLVAAGGGNIATSQVSCTIEAESEGNCEGFVSSPPPPPQKSLSNPPVRLAEVIVTLEDGDPGIETVGVHEPLRRAVAARLGAMGLPLSAITVVRKSLDARRHRRGNRVAFSYTVDIDITGQNIPKKLLPPQQSGHGLTSKEYSQPQSTYFQLAAQPRPEGRQKGRIVVVGAGPAGLFAALQLASAGARVTLLERGQAVDRRGADIGAMFTRRASVLAESNMCFGMGGAGTWSDGKLATGIGKNSAEVRSVLETFVELGAPPAILVQGKPHLGTDRMVHLLRQAHSKLIALGVDVRYNTKVTSLLAKGPGGRVSGVMLSSSGEAAGAVAYALEDCEAVLLAVGHSARDLYETLHVQGDVALSFQPFSAGLRAEHPQALINELQYGPKLAELAGWKQPLPAADYKLVASGLRTRYSSTREFSHASTTSLPRSRRRGRGEEAKGELDGEGDGAAEAIHANAGPTAAYSFCMCPGGQVVPTAMNPDYLCVNGMSYSKRSSPFANSGLVVPVSLADCLPFVSGNPSAFSSLTGDDEGSFDPTSSAAVLAGLAFQRAVERDASVMGGGNLVAPVQSIGDFLEETPMSSRTSLSEESLPSSYRLGVKRAPLHDLYPPQVTAALTAGLHKFEAILPGYVSRGLGVLHGAETRTSAPIRILRDPATLQSPSMPGLFPLGEGAGYAGGIVSAAVDGQRAAKIVLAELGIATGTEIPAPVAAPVAAPAAKVAKAKKRSADCR